jgi:hypothetical protein
MIINGEKTPAFSATTLSIPETPADHTAQIIQNSRQLYARPRAEVEAEIRQVMEAADKYKKELSDSGRAAGEQGSANNEKPAAKEKPIFQFQPTPQYEFKKQKISPNSAQGETESAGNGLKNLGALLAARNAELKQGAEAPQKAPEASEASEEHKHVSANEMAQKQPNSRSNNRRRNNNHRGNRNNKPAQK